MSNEVTILDIDSDGDGVLDGQDAFPNDASETADSDNDGVGDNATPSQMTVQKPLTATATASATTPTGLQMMRRNRRQRQRRRRRQRRLGSK